MTWLLDHYGKDFYCWLYLACVAGIKRGRGRKIADGRRRAWWRSSFFYKKKPNWRLKCKNRYPIYEKWLKNHTLWGRTYLYSPYKGIPPPGFGQSNCKKNCLWSAEEQLRRTRRQEKILPFAAVNDSEFNFPSNCCHCPVSLLAFKKAMQSLVDSPKYILFEINFGKIHWNFKENDHFF